MDKKKLVWFGSSKKDFMEFPKDVRSKMGYALYIAQIGEKHRDTKPLKGFGGTSVMEIVENDGNGTYRTVYTAEIKEIVYVLHAFKKKSKTGIKTPKQEIDLIEQRLKEVRKNYKELLKAHMKKVKNG